MLLKSVTNLANQIINVKKKEKENSLHSEKRLVKYNRKYTTLPKLH